jgi:hypothetical protein
MDASIEIPPHQENLDVSHHEITSTTADILLFSFIETHFVELNIPESDWAWMIIRQR